MFAIFDKVGGKDAAVAVLQRRLNWTPTKHTIKKWRANRAISPRAAYALLDECKERGIECDPIADFRAPSTEQQEAQG